MGFFLIYSRFLRNGAFLIYSRLLSKEAFLIYSRLGTGTGRRGKGFGFKFFGVVGNILGGQFLVFLEDAVDGKFRANDLTEIAINTLPLFGDQGRMIPFLVEFRGFLKDLIGAEFNTKIAAFASVFYNMQFSDRYGMGTGIKGQSPEFHLLSFYEIQILFIRADQKVSP
jgi:hypothetical protein